MYCVLCILVGGKFEFLEGDLKWVVEIFLKILERERLYWKLENCVGNGVEEIDVTENA